MVRGRGKKRHVHLFAVLTRLQGRGTKSKHTTEESTEFGSEEGVSPSMKVGPTRSSVHANGTCGFAVFDPLRGVRLRRGDHHEIEHEI